MFETFRGYLIRMGSLRPGKSVDKEKQYDQYDEREERQSQSGSDIE